MIRTLLIIAGAAFVLAMASMAGAVAIGGRDMAAHGWQWTFHDKDGDNVSFVRADDQRAAQTTRTLTWAGGDSLVVDLSADVTYIQGPTPGITITGPADRVDRVRMDGDRLTWAEDREGHHDERVVFGRRPGGRGIWVQSDTIHIVVTAPSVTRFDMRGSGDLEIQAYDQPTLKVESSGSGDLTASGHTTTLALAMSGSGDVDLGDLQTTDATADTSGSGDARIAPTGSAVLTLSGSGDIDLAERPTTLRQSTSGSGSVSQD